MNAWEAEEALDNADDDIPNIDLDSHEQVPDDGAFPDEGFAEVTEGAEGVEEADEIELIQEDDNLWAAAADSKAELRRVSEKLRETEAALAALEEDCTQMSPENEEEVEEVVVDAADQEATLDAAQIGAPTSASPPAPTIDWPPLGEAWPLQRSASSLSPSVLRQLPIATRRAVSGGFSPTFEATAVLCECIRAEGHDAVLLALQRLYAWLWSKRKAEVQDWIDQLGVHAALVDLLSCPGKTLALWTCHVIAAAALDHARNAKAFAEANATPALRAATARYEHDTQIAAAVSFAFAAYLPRGRK